MKIPVDQIPAGPTLDTAAARALGYQRMITPSDFGDGVVECWFDGEKQVDSFKPSGDIVDSLVLMKAEMLTISPYRVEPGKWFAICVELGFGPSGAIADTIPLAITRAFLKAHGVTELEMEDANDPS